MQYCDKVIASKYCFDEPVVLDGVTITGDRVCIEQCEKVTEWTTFCNNNPATVNIARYRTTIVFTIVFLLQLLKQAISIQENFNSEDCEMTADFPPKLEFAILKLPHKNSIEVLKFIVKGLNVNHTFQFLPGIRDVYRLTTYKINKEKMWHM